VVINYLVSCRSSLSGIAKSNNDHEKGREGQISCSPSVYVFVPCYQQAMLEPIVFSLRLAETRVFFESSNCTRMQERLK
jgi:hypothetical protein